MTTSVTPAGTRADEQWLMMTPGEMVRVRTPSEETAGVYTTVEIVADPGNGVPAHIHNNEDEHFLVLEGTLHMTNGDETLDVPAGSTLTVKKGVAHAWCNQGNAPVRFLLVFSPGGIEEMFRQVPAANGDTTAISAVFERFGAIVVGPPLAGGIYTVGTPRP